MWVFCGCVFYRIKIMETFLKFAGFIIIYIALWRAMDTTDGIMGWIFGLGFLGFIFWAFGGFEEMKKKD